MIIKSSLLIICYYWKVFYNLIIKLIGQGRFRECFATEDENLCGKRLKPYVVKRYGPFKVNFKAKIYSLLKFGTSDLNSLDFSIIQGLPEELGPYIPKNVSLNSDCLYMERVKDFDGTYSKTVQEFGVIDNACFWNHIERVKKILQDHDLWFFDLFHCGNNILVKKVSETEWVPVLIDFKRLGWQGYPAQVNLILDSEKHKKFNRRFKKFEAIFRQKNTLN